MARGDSRDCRFDDVRQISEFGRLCRLAESYNNLTTCLKPWEQDDSLISLPMSEREDDSSSEQGVSLVSTPRSRSEPVPSLVDRLVEHIRLEMADTWRRDDQLLPKFFPVEPASDFKFSPKARKELYNDNKNQKRWKGIPSKPKSVSRLYTPLTRLMNNILHCCGVSRQTRLFLNTHSESKPVVSTPLSPMSPSLFLAGAGEEFANVTAQLPRAFTQSGLSPIEVVLDSDNLEAARDRLAVNIHLMFQNQDNRRFAYGLVITETEVTVYMFDHSGAVASRPCNYHQDPEQFWAIIVGLASDKTGRTGFDSSIFGDGRYTKVRTFERIEDGSSMRTHYTLKERLFQFLSLVGRGTICWLATRPDEPYSRFVIKDAWIAPEELAGREAEASLLRHIQTRGVVAGVVQIRHSEEVRRGIDATDLDTVFRNRRVEDSSSSERALDRVHTRIVMDTHGKTLDRFATRKELLLAFHDAVLGAQDLAFSRDNDTLSDSVAHRNVHDMAGVLHRDISVKNILINVEGVEGDRGILIDFDHAIRVGDTSPYSTKTKIVFVSTSISRPWYDNPYHRAHGVSCLEMSSRKALRTHISTT